MDPEYGNIKRIVKGVLNPLFKQIEKEFSKIIIENEDLRKRLKACETEELTRKNTKPEKVNSRKSHSIKKGSIKHSNFDITPLAQFRDHNDVINEITSQKSVIATCSTDRCVKFWDLTSGKCLSSYHAHVGSVNSVRFHPQQDLVLTASGDCSAHIFSLNPPQGASQNSPLLELKGHKDTVSSADWLSSVDQVITASYDHNLHVYSSETGEWVTRLAGHSHSVRNVVTENCLVLSASADTTFKLWDLRIGGYPVKTYSFHTQAVNTVIFGPNNLVISAGDDRTVRIFDLRQSMCCLSTVPLPSGANRISINKETSTIAIPLDSGSIYLINCSGNNVAKFRGSSSLSHTNAVTCTSWVEGEMKGVLLSGGADSNAFAWLLPGLA